mgnify:CR=1 FL=1
MREMKDSGIEWIGAIPQNWQLSKIGSLYTQRNEKVSDKDYQPLSVTMQGILPQLATAAKTDDGDNRKLVRVGDFAINSRSDRRGSCGISPLDGSVSLINIILTPRTAMHPGYYNWLFHTTLFADEFYKWGHGIVADLWTTRWQEMKSITVPVPEYAEQERIAAFLDAECAEIDAVLEKTRASIEEYKKLKQAVITQAVTKGIRGDRPMKDSGIEWIGEIANEFAVYKFKYLLKTPMQYGANEAGITFDKTLPRYIRITDITSDGRLKQDNRLCIEDTVAKPYILQDGDLLFARSGGTVGKSFLYKQSYGNAAFAGYLIRAVVNRTIAVPEYVYYYTNSSIYDTWKNSIFIQSTIQNIGADRYSNMPIIVPNNIEEQRSIVEYLNERCVGIDAPIRKKQQYLTEIENYKKSLIYEYVTGKKEVV